MLTLFNANASFGNGCKFNPYFRDAAETLAHMDRFGIEKSLVWHTAAMDYNANCGNKRLLEEIKAVGAENRLIPSFTISPVMLYDEGSIEELVKEMSLNQIRAIRIFPGTLNHKLSQIEPVIQEIEKFKPVLFLDSRDSLDSDELLRLAEKFHDIPMVHMQGMWGNLVDMLDLLSRRENILIDTSWLHTPCATEMIVEKFGAERLVFGMGYKSHNGASIASLIHADISEHDRELIAHKNLEKLLGLPESTIKSTSFIGEDNRESSLWNKFISGRSLGIEVIDAHAHLGPCSTNITVKGEIEKQVEYLIPIMDKMNIKTMIVSGMQALATGGIDGNRVLEESMKPYKGRFLGYFVFNPLYGKELIPELDDFFSRDFFIGFKIHSNKWHIPLTDSKFEPVWEYADKHCLPICMHTWQGDYCSPVMLKEIAPKYPNAIFVLGHSGGGDKGRIEAEELALANRNVYLEFCGSFTASIPYEETINKVGIERILFGTDAMFHNPVWELGRALSLDIPDETIIPMLGENFKRIISKRK